MTALAALRKLVHDRAGIALDESKDYLLKSRLEPLARDRNITLDELASQARWNPQVAADVVEAMTTNETSFFRDVSFWTALETSVLPELAQLGTVRPKALHVWSAACSTGQEAYSLAILCRELGIRSVIHGTDISPQVVAKARSATYQRLEVNRGLAARRLLENFTQQPGDSWQVNDEVKNLCTFAVANLKDAAPNAMFDLVLLRNVLIYFDDPVRQLVLRNIERVIRPGGYLILGTSEGLLGVPPSFERRTVEGTTLWRKKS